MANGGCATPVPFFLSYWFFINIIILFQVSASTCGFKWVKKSLKRGHSSAKSCSITHNIIPYISVYISLLKIFSFTPLSLPKKERVPRRAVFINRLGAQHSLLRFDSGVPALVFFLSVI